MPRAAAPSHLHAPPLVYAGEREELERERADVQAKIRRNGRHSCFRPALERRLILITARLMAIGKPTPPVPGHDRKDLQ